MKRCLLFSVVSLLIMTGLVLPACTPTKAQEELIQIDLTYRQTGPIYEEAFTQMMRFPQSRAAQTVRELDTRPLLGTAFFELNADAFPEMIVVTDEDFMCTIEGCETYIFSPTEDGARKIAEFYKTSGEDTIYIDPNKTNGFHDLHVVYFNEEENRRRVALFQYDADEQSYIKVRD